MQRLKDLGVRIALCHFGANPAVAPPAGSFEFDTIKLDASRVKAMAHPAKASVAIAVAKLGAALGKTLVAEGVETQNEIAILVRHGCTHIQGPLVGSPGSVDPASRVLARTPASRPEGVGAGESGAAARRTPSDIPSAPRARVMLPMVDLSV